MNDLVVKKINQIKHQVGPDKVLLGISGGVDSSVAAVLISKAIKNQLTCVFIDNGLLRKDEANQVMETFQKYDIGVVKIDAKEVFLTKLAGIVDPENKRKVIGHTFIEVFKDASKDLGPFKFLAQGTLVSDVIESGSKDELAIKSHHNVGGLPEELGFELVEPFRDLRKDEVRQLGLALDMPLELINRQPFPGPGLAIRIIGDITAEKLSLVRKADFILQEVIKVHNLNDKIWQYFAVLTNIKTVGVKNNKRTYYYTIAIRAVNSVDGVEAKWAEIPLNVLAEISQRITNEVSGINRVVYDITSKPPATIEWE